MSATGATPIWPGGHRAALCISWDVDGPYGERNYRHPDDTYWLSQTEYDVAGTERALRLHADLDVPATFCWVGRMAEDRPDLVERAAAAGHEIALHTWDHRYLRLMSDAEQREDFLRTSATLERLTGVAPTGHKTGGWRYNDATHAIAQDLGLTWVMDIPTSDVPTILRPNPAGSPLVNLPPSWMWDDYNFYVDHMLSPMQVASAWQDDLDTLRDEGGLMSLTLHPFVSGRPGPSRGLARFIDYAISLGDIWIARADHIARWWLERERDTTGA